MSVTFPDNFNIADYFLFDRLAEGRGDRTALRYGDLTYSYDDVAERSRAVQRALAGVARGQVVYVVLPDCPTFAWAWFGVVAHGAVVAMGNPASGADALWDVLSYTRAPILITTASTAQKLADAGVGSAWLTETWLVPDTATGEDVDGPVALVDGLPGAVTLTDVMAAAESAPQLPPTHRDDPAVWLFTSGSTGRPKAAVHTHRDFAFNTEVYAKGTVGYAPDDVTVSVPNLYFGYATGTNLLFPFAVGATAALFSERPTPEALANAIIRYAPTVVTNVPTMMGKLLNHDEALRSAGEPGIDMSNVRFHLSAGEALPPALLDRFRARWDVDVYDGIGSAEMFHIYASNRPGDIKPGSLGRVVDGYEIAVLPENATSPGVQPLPHGETGVLWVKGDSVALCYHQDRDKSWETFHGHWCRTGDLFRLDESGYLWFSGRADSLLKVSGQWVAPLEVEGTLMTHAAVNLAAVIGAERDGLMRVKAFVVLRDSARGQEGDALRESLKAHVRGQLTHHKVPAWIVFVDEMPRNDRGKVDKKTLNAREAAGENPWA